jgi:lysophospholipase L1-like esterase
VRERLTTILAVTVAVVLVVVLGGIALRRVSERWDARREAAPLEADAGQVVAGPGPTDDVALVGDSITEQTEPVFHQALDASYKVRVRGRGGYRIEEMEPYAIEVAQAHPEQVVLNVGSNDVLKNWPIDKSVTALRRMIKDFDGVRCVHVVTINEGFYREADPDMGQRAALFNLELRRIATSDNLDVIDWSQAVADDTAAGSPKGLLTSDTVHPTDEGKKVLAGLYKDALDRCQ